jgi:hypothetical protein
VLLPELLQEPVVLHVVAGELHDVDGVGDALDVGDVGDRRGDRQPGPLAQLVEDRDLALRRAHVRVVLRRGPVVQQRDARRGERLPDLDRRARRGRARRPREHGELPAADALVAERHDGALGPWCGEGAFLWAHAAQDVI